MRQLTGALVVTVLASTSAWAGRACEERTAAPEATANAFDAALNLKTWLDKAQPRVALVARRGQNLEKYGLRYSHMGYVVHDPAGGWTIVHDLNKCGTAEADLYEQGLAEFFADDLFSYEVAIVVPTPELQSRLLDALSPAKRFAMHEAHYSAVAYPFATKYQNSNGWLLETYVQALSPVPLVGRTEAQHALQALQYAPSVLDIGPMTRLGGRVFKANVVFDDHPPSLRWTNRITVNTGDDLVKFTSQWAVPEPDCGHGTFANSVCVLTPPANLP